MWKQCPSGSHNQELVVNTWLDIKRKTFTACGKSAHLLTSHETLNTQGCLVLLAPSLFFYWSSAVGIIYSSLIIIATPVLISSPRLQKERVEMNLCDEETVRAQVFQGIIAVLLCTMLYVIVAEGNLWTFKNSTEVSPGNYFITLALCK